MRFHFIFHYTFLVILLGCQDFSSKEVELFSDEQWEEEVERELFDGLQEQDLIPFHGPYLVDQMFYLSVAKKKQSHWCYVLFKESNALVTSLEMTSCDPSLELLGKARNPDVLSKIEKARPLPSYYYSFTSKKYAHENNQPIDIEQENSQVSRFLRSFPAGTLRPVIVLGHTPSKTKRAIKLSAEAKKRLRGAYSLFEKGEVDYFIVTGGNVRPKATPYNEAWQMKRYLMHDLGVPEYKIALEPYAKNTVSNVRNVGRFMLTHGSAEALIYTSRGQSFYLSRPRLSTFYLRSIALLGFIPGHFYYLNNNTTLYYPNFKVFRPGRDKKDR